MGEGMKEGVNPEQVAAYLQEHPEFFELHSDMMANLFIPHPHGGRAIPISERQVLTLRDKNKLLETKLAELIRFGEQNDSISEKLHRLTVALLAAPDAPAAQSHPCHPLPPAGRFRRTACRVATVVASRARTRGRSAGRVFPDQ